MVNSHNLRIKRILEEGGDSEYSFYYHPILVKDIVELGFDPNKDFVRGIIAGKLGYTGREDRFRLSENSVANPWLRPSILTFPCTLEREGWIKDFFDYERIPNYFGCGEVYRYSSRFHNWFKRYLPKLKGKIKE